MKTTLIMWAAFLAAAIAGSAAAGARGPFKIETGKPLDAAFVRDFYLEGNSIPAEKRNAALVMTPSGKQLLFALLDTSGYSSQVQQKYLGMMITEGGVSVCGKAIPVGSYGFGLKRSSPTSNTGATFMLYNQAGAEIAACRTEMDLKLKAPRPLQAVVEGAAAARLYLGRNWVELK